MKWNPTNPICSNIQPRLAVSDYKKDIKFDFLEGDLVLNETVEGFECFNQKFIKVLLTDETPIIKYGLFELLPTSKNQTEFEKECGKLAYAIVSHQFSDSTFENPNGLGHTVEKIYSISKEVLNDINYLIVEASATGLNETSTIKVPLKLVEEHMQ
ncbi:hypothetical protein [Marinisporobacter balticus]|uniref:Uncharacterized protein n=1 Tax=Marinisporobacter balticus TaxID=2018667 RepID=A0A4R2KHR4_9FIRM|nr:hypothetical protein [Marinisporobacter balticus]TCO69538.1 hypothetical protein EV214_13162 [Marinisporobacter balticus]